jgi:hypothetical protein
LLIGFVVFIIRALPLPRRVIGLGLNRGNQWLRTVSYEFHHVTFDRTHLRRRRTWRFSLDRLVLNKANGSWRCERRRGRKVVYLLEDFLK